MKRNIIYTILCNTISEFQFRPTELCTEVGRYEIINISMASHGKGDAQTVIENHISRKSHIIIYIIIILCRNMRVQVGCMQRECP